MERGLKAEVGIIRSMEPADADRVNRLLKMSPEAAQWFVMAGASPLVAEAGGEIVGVILTRVAADEAEILNLAVAPDVRRKGIGTSLLETAISNLKRAGARSVFLEVRESNRAARAFYVSKGFMQSQRRRGYYRHPDDDALVLNLLL